MQVIITNNKSNFDKQIALKISLYFIVAFSISYFLNLLPNPLVNYGIKTNLNYAFGPFLSVIIVSLIFKIPLKLNLFSNLDWVRKIEYIGLIIFFIGAIAQPLVSGNTNYLLLIAGILLALIYTLLEEFGWRVFLGNELEKNPFLTIFIISTILWFFWHYSFNDENLLANPLQFLALIAGGSAGMAMFYKQTKSWIIVALTHAVISVNVITLVVFLVVTIGLLRLQDLKTKKQ